ncbi:MAG: transglycosylase domain-containing protein, partial [Rhizobiales bacterium]|nr:transglycosylase domain-containing protein [Hyphomicrobiales bacterium]
MLWRIFSSIFAGLFLILIVGIGVVAYIVWDASKDLPDHNSLKAYEPNVMSRMHAANGQLLAEYAEQRRLFIPYESIPQLTIQAVISAEDKNFFTHSGIDTLAFARAMFTNLKTVISGKNKRLIGASTITQQVAKNFLLTNERTYTRKVKEALLTMRIEESFSKNKILELYLNENNFGFTLIDEGILTTSWNHSSMVKVADDEVLFSLKFLSTAETQLSEVLTITHRYTTAEAYSDKAELYDINLNYTGGTINASAFVLYQNTPNPFN